MDSSKWSPLDALTDAQREKLRAYESHLLQLNQKMNLVSPATEADAATVHVLHSLTLLYRSFPPGSVVVDWGTGGGLPAIPLAICCPDVTVHAIDSVGKKVRAVRTMARRLELDNCFPWHGRADAWPGTAHYSVSRATAPLRTLWRWHARVASPENITVGMGDWAPGLLCLKGGDLSDEIATLFAEDGNVCVDQYRLRALLDPGDAIGQDKQLVGVFSTQHTPPLVAQHGSSGVSAARSAS